MNTLILSETQELTLTSTLPIDQNPAAVYLSNLRENGRRTQKQALDMIAGMLTGDANCLYCNWGKLRYQHTAAIRSRLSETYKAATVNKFLSALRGVLKQALLLKQIPAEDYQMAIMVKNVESETLPAGRELSNGEILALMQACENDSSSAGVRDAAIIAVMYSCGLRREEVVNIEYYDPETGKLIVHGKRNKDRTVYLTNGAQRALADWLNIRRKEVGKIFWPINKSGKLINRNLTTQAIYNLLHKRAEEAGVGSFSPHDLRRTFVSDLLDAGADISTVSKIAGHANVQTTARYDRRPEEAKKKASELLHVPYRGRK